MESLIVGIIAFELIIGAFAGYVAAEKNRNSAGWFFLGLFFSLIALFSICGLPVKKTS